MSEKLQMGNSRRLAGLAEALDFTNSIILGRRRDSREAMP